MTNSTSPEPKRIALVAHDGRKDDLLEWAEHNRDLLAGHSLYATGTTGRLLSEALDLPVTRFQSGPLGGDQQIGALIALGELDMLIFFWDPMSSQPHDSDVKALVRLAVLWDIPIACNRTSADYLITSPLLGESRTPARSAARRAAARRVRAGPPRPAHRAVSVVRQPACARATEGSQSGRSGMPEVPSLPA